MKPAFQWIDETLPGWGMILLSTVQTSDIVDFFLPFPLQNDDVIKWKHFPRYWPFVRGIHRWPVNSPHKGQWRGALMFSLICTWNAWVNNREAGDLRRHRVHYDVIVMVCCKGQISIQGLVASRSKQKDMSRADTISYILNSVSTGQ